MQRNWGLQLQAPFALLAGWGWWGDIGLFFCVEQGWCGSCLGATRDATGLPVTGAAMGSTKEV